MTEKTKWLSEYGINLTEKYRNSKELAIAIGRDKEIREITEVLTKKTKANVALTGKPGTGKTRIVEGLASKIATGNTVDALKDVDIWELDLALLTNTDESDGGFSYRLKKIIDEAKESNIILFIDEMHTIIAAGAKKGGLDGSNILKPALARGEIKMIGATTSEEYRIIERDPAFQRRFQQIYISEPSREDSINILKFRKRSFEIFFGINIDDSAIEAAVDLSIRYLPSRSLPDKAIDILDQSSASLKLDLDSLPSNVESKSNKLLNLKAELKMNNSLGQRKLEDKIQKLEKELEDDKLKISIQKEALELLKNFRQALKEKEDEFRKLKESKGSEEKLAELTSEIKNAFDTLENYKEIYEQGEPLINDTLYASNIQQTIENLTGIPVSDMNKSERDKIKNLESDIAKRMIGQKEAVKAVSYAIKRNRLGLGSPDQPIFVGMFLGVSGTGKRLPNDVDIPVYTPDNSLFWKKNGELKEGDYVYNVDGKPVRVLGTYNKDVSQVYIVKFRDGRTIKCDGEHLWTYRGTGGNSKNNWKTATTKEIMEKGLYSVKKNGIKRYKYAIPVADAIYRDALNLPVHPYVLGAFLGNGCLTLNSLSFSSNDKETVELIANLINAEFIKKSKSSYTWNFYKENPIKRKNTTIKTKEVFGELSDSIMKYANEKYIPELYKNASIEQRWELVRGLMDTDGSILNNSRKRISYSTSSKILANDFIEVLNSLGYMATISENNRKNKNTEYIVYIKANDCDKHKFFNLTRKKDIAMTPSKKERVKDFSHCTIESITPTNEYVPMTCIKVEDPRHLYLAGKNYIVTHNTELVKTLADKYFGDERAMKRFDMGEFKSINSISRLIGANPGEGDADDRGGELTEWAKHNPYSIILFDEAEKAHSQVWDLMLSLFDDGVLTDSRGDVVDFKNTIIIMTSNLGSQLIARGFDKETGELDQATKDNVQALLRNPDADKGGKGFKPEFINRIDSIVIFGPLSDSELEDIATLKLKSLKKRLIKSRNIKLVFGKKIVPTLKTKATLDVSNWLVQQLSWDDKKLGARPINRYITTEIEDKIVDMLLQEGIEDGENILIKPKHPTPLTYIGKDGQERPTPPILDFSTVSDKEYKSLIKEDPVENWVPSDEKEEE